MSRVVAGEGNAMDGDVRAVRILRPMPSRACKNVFGDR